MAIDNDQPRPELALVPSIGLTAAEPEVDEALVEMLESLTARARTGEILSVVVCGDLTGREAFTAISGEVDVLRSIGALEMLKMRLLAAVDDDED